MSGFLGKLLAQLPGASDTTTVLPAELLPSSPPEEPVLELAEENSRDDAEPAPVPSPMPTWEYQVEAEALLAKLREDLAQIEAEQPGGRFSPLRAKAVRNWVEGCEEYVKTGAKEASHGWDALAMLRNTAKRAIDQANREVEYLATVDVTRAKKESDPPPRMPRGAKLFFQDDAGRPVEKSRSAHWWCWEKGPCWLDVRNHPIPIK